jgi:putative chitinase
MKINGEEIIQGGMIMSTPKELLDLLLTQDGDPYVFGFEVSPSDSNPKAFDCSELVEWGCARLGVTPTMPDGATYQVRHCQKYGLIIPVKQAIQTPGALLFAFSDDPFTGDRPDHAHVAVSQGNGKTFEARGRAYGVGTFNAAGRGWTHAGKVPGLNYGESETSRPPVTTAPGPGPSLPPVTTAPEEVKSRNYRVTAANSLNIRSGPGTEYEVEGELEHGEVVISPDTADWLPILLEDDSIGWVSRKYVEAAPEKVCAGTAATPDATPEAKPGPAPVSGGLTAAQLHQIVPSLSATAADSLTQYLNLAMAEAEINTPLRQAAFLAQVAHESQGLSRFVENLNYSAEGLLDVFGKYFTPDEAEEYARQPEKIADRVYANRLGNGDENSGDGWRYRGRGFIQVTGKDNYRAAGKFLKQPLVDQPESAAALELGARIAAWYWTSRGLNPYADREQFDTITKRINGGLHGLKDRRAYYERAKEVLEA